MAGQTQEEEGQETSGLFHKASSGEFPPPSPPPPPPPPLLPNDICTFFMSLNLPFKKFSEQWPKFRGCFLSGIYYFNFPVRGASFYLRMFCPATGTS